MIKKKLGKGTDFDLAVFNAQTNEEYTDDGSIIQRNTSVLASRLPAAKPGKGTAQRYLGVVAPIIPKQMVKPAVIAKPPVRPMGTASSEMDGIQQMFKQQAQQWEDTQEKLATAKAVYRPPMGGGTGAGRGKMNPMMYMEVQKPPPPGYTCYRCGEKGHYINVCPTIGDANYDNKPKIKRATGIPNTFLQTVENKEAIERGLMLTTDGNFVVPVVNEDKWNKIQQKNKTLKSIGDAYHTAPVPSSLSCFICKKLLKDCVTSPCCNTNFCDECAQQELYDPVDASMRYRCPSCERKLAPDQLKINREIRRRVDEHLKSHIQSKDEDRKRKHEDDDTGDRKKR
ncbi:hypothetical protein HDV06_005441 [Boothiomyces sp. JEL0866]|nr:hypothetical protein HDV06_005441 [Boothiomyces sp. JEL0866]